jgi:ubiquinone/menaquinone biosynthesis C-methylase UbiE
MADAARSRAYYQGSVATEYDAKRVTQKLWKAENEAVEDFLTGVTGTVLDIPVGTGRYLGLYEKMGVKVVGRDVNEDMLAEARKKHPGADLAVADVLALDMADKSIETIVCVRLLNLLSETEMQQALAELQRVASQRIIMTLRTGKKIKLGEGGRQGQTQRRRAFLDALKGWKIEKSRPVLSERYRLYSLVPQVEGAPSER